MNNNPKLTEPEQAALDLAVRPPVRPQTEKERWFGLTRRLRSFGGEPTAYKSAVRIFCEHTPGAVYLDVITSVVNSWKRVEKVDDGKDIFEQAMAESKTNPLPTLAEDDVPAPEYLRVASMAWFFFKNGNGEPFCLYQERIAKELNCCQKTVGNIIAWLVEEKGVLNVVDATYIHSRRGGNKGKTYLLNSSFIPLVTTKTVEDVRRPEKTGEDRRRQPSILAPLKKASFAQPRGVIVEVPDPVPVPPPWAPPGYGKLERPRPPFIPDKRLK